MRINIISEEKQIYEERKENGQWMKSIEFKLPIIEKEFTLSLDNDTQNETVLVKHFCNTLFDKYLPVTSLHWC